MQVFINYSCLLFSIYFTINWRYTDEEEKRGSFQRVYSSEDGDGRETDIACCRAKGEMRKRARD